MISKATVEAIKQDLLLTDLALGDIAKKHKVSRTSVVNINTGKSYPEQQFEYPIRSAQQTRLSDNEASFIKELVKLGYSAKQIHIILGKTSYTTISNVIQGKTRASADDYKPDGYLEKRKYTFDLIATPWPQFVNTYTDSITLEDAIYIKLLGRFMAPIEDVIEIFLPIIESDFVATEFPIESREDLLKYLEWGGTRFPTIWWIKGIFVNKINNIQGEPIFYDDFAADQYLIIDEYADIELIKEMIAFETKENFKRRSL